MPERKPAGKAIVTFLGYLLSPLLAVATGLLMLAVGAVCIVFSLVLGPLIIWLNRREG